jgi:hypothetical protein
VSYDERDYRFIDPDPSRYHAHLHRLEWLAVTQAFEEGLKVSAALLAVVVLLLLSGQVVRQLKTVVEGSGLKNGAMNEALRQVEASSFRIVCVFHRMRRCSSSSLPSSFSTLCASAMAILMDVKLLQCCCALPTSSTAVA